MSLTSNNFLAYNFFLYMDFRNITFNYILFPLLKLRILIAHGGAQQVVNGSVCEWKVMSSNPPQINLWAMVQDAVVSPRFIVAVGFDPWTPVTRVRACPTCRFP